MEGPRRTWCSDQDLVSVHVLTTGPVGDSNEVVVRPRRLQWGPGGNALLGMAGQALERSLVHPRRAVPGQRSPIRTGAVR